MDEKLLALWVKKREIEAELGRVIEATRLHKGGIPLYRVAEIIAEEMDWAELSELSKYLSNHSTKKREKNGYMD